MSSFTPAGSAGSVGSVSLQGVTSLFVDEIDMPVAGTEYSFELPTNTKFFILKLRSEEEWTYSYLPLDTKKFSVPRGNFKATSELNLTAPVSIFFTSSKASQTMEVEYGL